MDNEQIRYYANRVTAKRLNDVATLMAVLSTSSFAIWATSWIHGMNSNLFVLGFVSSSALQVIVLYAIRKAISWEISEYRNQPIHREPPESEINL